MKSGVSAARMALQCSINANLVRRWITQRIGVDMKTGRAHAHAVVAADGEAFVALRLAAPLNTTSRLAPMSANTTIHNVA
jgi:transposase-like protein